MNKLNILLFNFNNVLTDVEEELKKRGHTILDFDGKESTSKKADVVLVWNEVDYLGNRDWIIKMQKLGKRVILVQHGRRATSRIYPPFNEKLQSDTVCCWGSGDKARLIECGADEKRIRVTGTSIFSHLKPRVKHKGYNVLFSPEHWDKEVMENLMVADELRKLKRCGFKKINVTTKGFIGDHKKEWYQNFVGSNRHEAGHFEVVADVLSKADVLVAISESTLELFAEYLDIPVVIADIWIPKACGGDERYKNYKRIYSDACTKVKLNELNKEIKKQLKNPSILREERKKIVIEDGGVDIKNPLDEIIRVIIDTASKK